MGDSSGGEFDNTSLGGIPDSLTCRNILKRDEVSTGYRVYIP